MDCGESGSTLRFLIPLAALDGNCYNFIGEGELGTRPLTPYETLFKEENLHFHYGSERHFPLSVQGPLKSGHFVVPGDVSSQFISGLLLPCHSFRGILPLKSLALLNPKVMWRLPCPP